MILTIILIILLVLSVLMLLGAVNGNPIWMLVAMIAVILFMLLGGTKF